MNHAIILANSIMLFHRFGFGFFLSLTKRACAFNAWNENIFTADIINAINDHKCHVKVQRGKVVTLPCFANHQTCWGCFQICSISSQFQSVQSWIFSMLLFSKSFISFSIRATLYLSSWNFATGTWNRIFRLENMKQLGNFHKYMPVDWDMPQYQPHLLFQGFFLDVKDLRLGKCS